MIENSLQNLRSRFEMEGKLRRDYTYVKDCVRALIGALAAENEKLENPAYLARSYQ